MGTQSTQPAQVIAEMTGNPNAQEHTPESFGRRLFERVTNEAAKQLKGNNRQDTVDVSLHLKAKAAPNDCFHVWEPGDGYILVCGVHIHE